MTNQVTADWMSGLAPRRCRCRDDEIAAVGRRAVILAACLYTAGVQQSLMRGQMITTTVASSVVKIKAAKWRVSKCGTRGRRRWVVTMPDYGWVSPMPKHIPGGLEPIPDVRAHFPHAAVPTPTGASRTA